MSERWKVEAGEVTDGTVSFGVVAYDSSKVTSSHFDSWDIDDAMDACWLPRLAAALNAAEQAGRERELLKKADLLLAGKATGSICIVDDEFGDEYDAPGCWWCGSLHGASHSAVCEYAAWLVEYAALTKEQP